MNRLPKFSYIQSAWEDRPKLWLYLVGVLIVTAINFAGQILTFGILYVIAEDPSKLLSSDGAIDISGLGIPPALSLFLIILPFIFVILGLWICLTGLHKRNFFTLFSASGNIDWGRFFLSFGIWFGLTILLEIIAYLMAPSNYSFTFEPVAFFPILIVSILFLPLQTSAEELLFRGYLMQGIGAGTRKGWIAILFTSLFFASLHMANPEIGKYGYILVINYIGVGILTGIITLMDERIELALGMHAANNVYGATIVTFSGSVIQTPALFTISEINVSFMVLGWFIPAGIFLAIVAFRYRWDDWQKLFQRIPNPEPSEDEDISNYENEIALNNQDKEGYDH